MHRSSLLLCWWMLGHFFSKCELEMQLAVIIPRSHSTWLAVTWEEYFVHSVVCVLLRMAILGKEVMDFYGPLTVKMCVVFGVVCVCGLLLCRWFF